jgi:hypothetical protein
VLLLLDSAIINPSNAAFLGITGSKAGIFFPKGAFDGPTSVSAFLKALSSLAVTVRPFVDSLVSSLTPHVLPTLFALLLVYASWPTMSWSGAIMIMSCDVAHPCLLTSSPLSDLNFLSGTQLAAGATPRSKVMGVFIGGKVLLALELKMPLEDPGRRE